MLRIDPVGYRPPIYQPNPVRPTAAQKTTKAEVPFGLNTLSFGHQVTQAKLMTPLAKPHPNVGKRLDYYA